MVTETILVNGNSFRIWYDSYNNRINALKVAESLQKNYQSLALYPTSIKDTNPITVQDDGLAIPVGTSGSWDNKIRVESGNVIYQPGNPIGGNYLLFYTGYTGAYPPANEGLGIAYSTDGISWTKYAGNPVLNPGSTYGIEDPYVVFNSSNNTYYLYTEDQINGINGNINISLYTSSNLVDWIFTTTALSPSISGWDSGFVGSPLVWIEGTKWYMLYEGGLIHDIGKEGLATSTNGTTWSKSGNNPVFSSSQTTWASGSLSSNDIVKDSGIYYQYYIAYDGTSFKPGRATSSNLTSWTEMAGNPFDSALAGMFRASESNLLRTTTDSSGINISHFVSTTPPPTPPPGTTYQCINNVCTPSACTVGTTNCYTTNNCNNVCTSPLRKYRCVNNTCTQDDINGTFTEPTCGGTCASTPPPTTSECDPITCPPNKNFCIAGTCIPREYVVFTAAGFFMLLALK